jgi:predicted amidophosphoribosyltransferase
MNEETHSQQPQETALAACTATWPQLSSGIRYKHLVDYYSYNAFGAYSLSNEEWDNREMIHNFKNNSELTDPISHLNAMNKAIELFTALLRDSFGDLLPQLTLVCIPASTAEKTAARFEEFARLVCKSTGMANGYEHIQVVADQEYLSGSHLPQYDIDAAFFNERPVLLFDDIMATGGSVTQFANRMAETGAQIVAAVVLGKAVPRKQE